MISWVVNLLPDDAPVTHTTFPAKYSGLSDLLSTVKSPSALANFTHLYTKYANNSNSRAAAAAAMAQHVASIA